MDLDYFITPTNEKHYCYLPKPRDKFLVAGDIIDKLEDLEVEISCEILRQLIAWFSEVTNYLVKNHIDLIIEEEDL